MIYAVGANPNFPIRESTGIVNTPLSACLRPSFIPSYKQLMPSMPPLSQPNQLHIIKKLIEMKANTSGIFFL